MRLDYDYDSSDRSDLRWFHGAPGWNFVTFKRRASFACLHPSCEIPTYQSLRIYMTERLNGTAKGCIRSREICINREISEQQC